MSEENTHQKEYAIFWRNKYTQVQGHSDPMLTKDEAEEIANMLNKDVAWSHLEHWAGKVTAEAKS